MRSLTLAGVERDRCTTSSELGGFRRGRDIAEPDTLWEVIAGLKLRHFDFI